MSEQPVRCARCHAEANVVVQGQTPVRVNCPKCGESQTYSEFQQSLGEQAAAHAQMVIGGSLAEMARNNKHFTYKPGRVTSCKPKFTVSF